ncbi:NAD-dependent epimerase [Gammaproteobacteria bacterium]|nr:NAD-dependent epimerase [Gammaproteobacteria bacterium]
MKVLVTGSAGFIGSSVVIKLLKRGDSVIGIDNHNDYYDPSLKEARLARFENHENYQHLRLSLEDKDAIFEYFDVFRPDRVINLAAQAGVRYSLTNPHAYIDANVQGFTNILEACRHIECKHLTYASSSSVYGGNTKLPFSEHDSVDHPVSLYAATKKANELMAHTYSHLYGLPTTGLRFFTVYGPWGRPDMALFLFTKAILEGRAIDIYNNGEMTRDFTFIDDIVEGVIRVNDKTATPNREFNSLNPDPASSNAPYRVFNIGNSRPTPLMDYIKAIEKSLDKTAEKNFLPLQSGDVPATSSDTSELEKWVGFKPDTSIEIGVKKFVDWYKDFYKI